MKSDSELKREIISRLELEPKIDPAVLGVSVEDGVVTLRGSVESEEELASTERVVRVIPGVKGLVGDELTVKSASRTRPKDADLEARAMESIRWLTVPQEGIRITSRNGWLTVEGEVEFRHQAQSVEDVLREIAGVHGVRNLLTVRVHGKAA